MEAPHADALAYPVPKNMYARRIPTPGPGFDSTRNRSDLPLSSVCWMPRGTRTPLPMALLRKSTLAGSTMTLISGRRWLVASHETASPSTALIWVTSGARLLSWVSGPSVSCFRPGVAAYG